MEEEGKRWCWCPKRSCCQNDARENSCQREINIALINRKIEMTKTMAYKTPCKVHIHWHDNKLIK